MRPGGVAYISCPEKKNGFERKFLNTEGAAAFAAASSLTPLPHRRTAGVAVYEFNARKSNLAGICHDYQFLPVEPKPPAPRAVEESSFFSSNTAVMYGVMTSWAMRSPEFTVRASPEWLCSATITSPR